MARRAGLARIWAAPDAERDAVGEFTAEQKMKVAEREVRQRKNVYRRLVKYGDMTQADADFQIKAMQEIANDYRRQLEPNLI